MKRIFNTRSLFLILIGLAVSITMYILADRGDAPGLSLLGFSSGFLLIMFGLYNAGMIKKGFLAPILMLCFGVSGELLSVVLMLDGEFENQPILLVIGISLGLLLIGAGAITVKNKQKRCLK